MKTLLEILTLSTHYLQQHGIQNPRRQAEDLISDALGMQRLNLYLEFDRPLTESELEICRQRLTRRSKGEPLQYIQGDVEFYGCKIFLNKDVLIPRQETEILVDLIVKDLEKEDLIGKSLWDLCCGSGCIGIALKKRFPLLKVVLSDISIKALELAKKNAKENQIDVQFLHGNLLEPFLGKKTDYLVCNPPYIAEEEFSTLEAEVRHFEPKQALVSGSTGLEIYSHLATDLKKYLTPLAKVWFEIGSTQGSAMYELFPSDQWRTCEVKNDWSGKNRFFFLENE